MIEPARLWVRTLLELIEVLRRAILERDKQIRKLMNEHPDARLYEGLPGAANALAPRLLAAMGTDRERFASAGNVASYSGIGPRLIRSGRTEQIQFRWKCPKFMRQSFHEFARCSLGRSRWARAYYEQQRARGHDHHAAVRSLAFKWIRIIYRCWLDRTPYDESRYLATLARRGSPLAAAVENL